MSGASAAKSMYDVIGNLKNHAQVPATSLMKLLNQSGTWYHEDPFEQPPGDTRCLCRDLNESFIWVEDDLPESEPEEPPPEYYQEQEMMRQYYEQQQEAGGGVRRAASF